METSLPAAPSSFDELKRAFAKRTSTCEDDWFLVFKARYGMRTCFHALRELYGEGSVSTTLFTGCTAVDSIIDAGLVPVYEPICPATLGMDVGAAEFGESTWAVLLQHSYGIVDHAASAVAAQKAHDAGAVFVEDSAHCVARMARDDEGNPLADVSIHSFGIEKTFSNLYFGGAIWINPHMQDTKAHDRMVQALGALPPLPKRIDGITRRYRNQTRMLSHLPGAASRILRESLLARGQYEPPVARVERKGGLPYETFLPSSWIVDQILPMFLTLDADEQRRTACGRRYNELLHDLVGDVVPQAAFDVAGEQPLIRYPLVLPNEGMSLSLRADLLRAGFYAVDWYRMPFYPGAVDPSYYFTTQKDVDSYRMRYAGTVGLPTDVAPERVDDVVSIVRKRI